MKRFLERPHGMRDFALGEMRQRQAIEQSLLAEFALWGYQAVETPLLEYAVTFAKGVHEGEEERMYRLFDAYGQTLALRPEMTTPVARLAATVLVSEPLPLRLCYSAKTYREQGQHAREVAEVTQVGIELLGETLADGDAEVIAIMAQALARLGLQQFRMALGHVGYVRAQLQGVSEPLREELVQALMERDIVHYEQALLASAETCKSEQVASLLHLPRIRGGYDAIAEARVWALSAAAQAACDELEELYATLTAQGVNEWVQLDMGLYPHHDYYTGVVMEGYSDSVGQRICYGGRYDHLLGKFGRPLAATGCVMHLERLQEVAQALLTDGAMVFLAYDVSARAVTLGFARELRARGYQVAATRSPHGAVEVTQANGQGDARRAWIKATADGPQLVGDTLLAEMFAQYVAGRDVKSC